jgi:hypothetical protein
MIALLIALSSVLVAVSATLLPVDSMNPCTAYLNGSTLAIGNLFNWPVVLKHQKGNSPSGFYTYEWDCLGQRTTCGAGVTVCQVADHGITYVAGGAPGSALWLTDRFAVPTQLTISYPSTFLRQASITVVNSATTGNASVVFMGEVLTEQYNFVATVNCGKYFMNCQ